jgi:hypothetical protein
MFTRGVLMARSGVWRWPKLSGGNLICSEAPNTRSLDPPFPCEVCSSWCCDREATNPGYSTPSAARCFWQKVPCLYLHLRSVQRPATSKISSLPLFCPSSAASIKPTKTGKPLQKPATKPTNPNNAYCHSGRGGSAPALERALRDPHSTDALLHYCTTLPSSCCSRSRRPKSATPSSRTGGIRGLVLAGPGFDCAGC